MRPSKTAESMIAAALLISTAAPSWAFNPQAGDFDRDQPNYVRVMAYNVLDSFPSGTAAENAAFNRILLATNPDIIVMEEVPAGTNFQDVRTRLDSVLGGSWQAWLGISDGSNRNMLCSRYPVTMVRTDTDPESEARGVICGLVDLPDATYSTDFYIMGVHMKCCNDEGTEDARRQQHADAIVHWMGDLRSPGGVVNLPANTPMLVMGDFNFGNTFSTAPHTTLLTGNIVNEATYGPDIKGDWDNTDISEALPADPYDLDFETWNSSTGNPSQRFDRIYFTDSVATVAQSFVLNTNSMTSTQLAGAGLLAADSETASDHLPVIADFALGGVTPQEPLFGDVFITEIMGNPQLVADTAGEWFEVFNSTTEPVDINGWIIRDQGSNFHIINKGGPLLVPAKGYLVLGRDTNTGTNGSVNVAYSYGSAISFQDSSIDTLELYRGSRKVDGVRWAGGPVGQEPANHDWGGSFTSAFSREMQPPYFDGRNASFANAIQSYNAVDHGTPGALNGPGAVDPGEPSGWLGY